MGWFGKILGTIAGAAIAGPLGGALAGAAGAAAGFAAGSSYDAGRDARKAYKQQASQISEQMELNREVSEFNKTVHEKLYPEVCESIRQETSRMLARQQVVFAANGVSPGGASPLFVLGSIQRMGDKQLQEAAFNHMVDMRNEEFRARGVMNGLNSQLTNARYNAKAAGMSMWDGGIGGLLNITTTGLYFNKKLGVGNGNGAGVPQQGQNYWSSSGATEHLNRSGLSGNRWVG